MSSKSMVSMDLDFSDVVRMLRAGDAAADRAVVRALNRGARSLAAKAAQEISAETKVSPQRLIKRRIKRDAARQGHHVATVRCMTRDIPLIKVARTRDTKTTGVSSPPGHWPRAFIAKGVSPTQQVFQRKGRAPYPLDVVKVRVQDTVESVLRRRADEAIEVVAKRLPVELNHEWSKGNVAR